MAAFLVCALAIPEAFDETGVVFGIAAGIKKSLGHSANLWRPRWRCRWLWPLRANTVPLCLRSTFSAGLCRLVGQCIDSAKETPDVEKRRQVLAMVFAGHPLLFPIGGVQLGVVPHQCARCLVAASLGRALQGHPGSVPPGCVLLCLRVAGMSGRVGPLCRRDFRTRETVLESCPGRAPGKAATVPTNRRRAATGGAARRKCDGTTTSCPRRREESGAWRRFPEASSQPPHPCWGVLCRRPTATSEARRAL